MTLIIVLNAMLAVVIVGVVVALHAAAILSDRPRRERPVSVGERRTRPVPPPAPRPQPRLFAGATRRSERDEVAAGV